jgi:predicted DNA-binding ribbon-helix-helix protein
MSEKRHTFLQSVDDQFYNQLFEVAKARGMSIQKLLRHVVIPDWVKWNQERPREK